LLLDTSYQPVNVPAKGSDCSSNFAGECNEKDKSQLQYHLPDHGILVSSVLVAVNSMESVRVVVLLGETGSIEAKPSDGKRLAI